MRMSVTIRKPDGGEAVMFLKDTDNVETLRAMLTWCASAKQWDCDAIPRDIINQHKNKSEADTETEEKKEEMWTLGGEPETYENATHKPWEVPHSEEEVDFEQAATQDTTVHEDESKAARIELMFGPIVLQDGYTLAEYGVESGSFVHPIYGLRPKEGGGPGWDQVVQSLPWADREWYRSGLQIGSKLSLSASAAVQDKLSSVVGWWGGGGGGGAGAEGGGEEGTEEAGERTEVAPGGVEEQNNLL